MGKSSTMPKPSKAFAARIQPDLMKQVEKEARGMDATVSWMVRHLLKKGLEAHRRESAQKAANAAA